MNLHIIAGMIGAPQIILIIVAIVFLFGGKKIPELMKGFGKGLNEFKKVTNEDADTKKSSESETESETTKKEDNVK